MSDDVLADIKAAIYPAKRDAYVVAGFNAVLGSAWLLQSPHRTAGNAYTPVRQIVVFLPFDGLRFWAGLLVLSAVLMALALWTGHDRFTWTVLALLATFWVWWSLTALYGFYLGGSLGASIFSAGWAWRHWRLFKIAHWLSRG